MTLGVRPEHLKADKDGEPIDVIVVEPMGSETQVVAKAGAHKLICLFRDRQMPKPGERIRVSRDPGLIHLFDPDTGRSFAA